MLVELDENMKIGQNMSVLEENLQNNQAGDEFQPPAGNRPKHSA